MDLFLFTARDEVTVGKALLVPFPQGEVSQEMWDELAACIADYRTILPYSADILAQRYREGYASVLIWDGHIVSYTSLAPVALNKPGTHSWTQIMVNAGVEIIDNPLPDIYTFTSSWTDPNWRHKHINLALRLPLVERYLTTETLGIAGMVTLTHHVMANFGCQIIGWDSLPFVTSLLGVPANEYPSQAATGWRIPSNLICYQGPHIPLDQPGHEWGKYCYFWVTSTVMAKQVNQDLQTLLRGDLAFWRRALITTFSRPDSPHKLAYLP